MSGRHVTRVVRKFYATLGKVEQIQGLLVMLMYVLGIILVLVKNINTVIINARINVKSSVREYAM